MSRHFTACEMLERLVAFPTVSRDTNLPLVEFVSGYLEDLGVNVHTVANEDGTKANLYAQIGPPVEGGVVLSGHTDVVPVDGQNWSSDPFKVSERDGRLYARGSCDMKGFDAIVLSMVPEMLAAGLKRPIQIALSYDEEVGLLGVPSMIAEMREKLPLARAVIVGEPTMMQVVTRHKGGIGTRTHVRGYPVHSSLIHTGVSAVMQAAKLVEWHSERLQENRENAGPNSETAFDPPYTTLHVGTIEGGTANNITAENCVFNTEIRFLPGESGRDWLARYRQRVADVEAAMKAVRPESSIDVHIRADFPGCRKEAPNEAHAETLARALTGDNGEHAVSYATEAGLFQDSGYSVCICGPGSIEQAHKADEFIDISQLEAGETFVRRLIERLSA